MDIMNTINAIGVDKAIVQMMEAIKAKDIRIAELEAEVATFKAMQITLGNQAPVAPVTKEVTKRVPKVKSIDYTKELVKAVKKITGKISPVAVLSKICVIDGVATVSNMKQSVHWKVDGIADGLYMANRWVLDGAWILDGNVEEYPTKRVLPQVGEVVNYPSVANDHKLVSNSASTDETRYFLNGVLLDAENQVIVATDGRRLAYSNAKIVNSNRGSCIIPYVNLGELIADTCTIHGAGETYYVEYTNNLFNLTVMGIQGQFPNWKRVVPTASTSVDIVFPSLETIKEWKELRKIAGSKCDMFVFNIDGSVYLNESVYEKGKWVSSPVPIETKKHVFNLIGAEKVAMNIDYIIDAINNGVTTMSSESASRAFISQNGNITTIIMPGQTD